MVELRVVTDGGELPPVDQEGWLRFLRNEGLEAMAAFRSIQDPTTRAAFLGLMKDAAAAERKGTPKPQDELV